MKRLISGGLVLAMLGSVCGMCFAETDSETVLEPGCASEIVYIEDLQRVADLLDQNLSIFIDDKVQDIFESLESRNYDQVISDCEELRFIYMQYLAFNAILVGCFWGYRGEIDPGFSYGLCIKDCFCYSYNDWVEQLNTSYKNSLDENQHMDVCKLLNGISYEVAGHNYLCTYDSVAQLIDKIKCGALRCKEVQLFTDICFKDLSTLRGVCRPLRFVSLVDRLNFFEYTFMSTFY